MDDDHDDCCLVASGPMPEWLRNKDLPELPPGTPRAVADLAVLAAMNRDRLGYGPEDVLAMGEARARIEAIAARKKLGIRPLVLGLP